jgi:tetratricopeptide (TPR) repeat protein
MNSGSVMLTAYDDDRMIRQGDSLLDLNKTKAAIAKYNRAFAYLLLDDYRHALQDYDRVIRLDSTDFRNLSNRALVKWYLKNYNGAIADCDKAIKLNAKYAYAYFHKGISEFELHRYREAIVCYDQAIQLDPAFTRAFYNRGNSKFELDDQTGACADWSKAKSQGHEMSGSMLQKYCK